MKDDGKEGQPDEPDGRGRPAETLKNSWTGDYKFTSLSGHDPEGVKRHWPLLQRAYESIYLKNFPLIEGNDSIEKWEKCLNNNDKDTAYTLTIASKETPAGIEPVGLLVSVFYKNSRTAYLGYVAVADSEQGKGLGKALMQRHYTACAELARRNPCPTTGHKGVKGFFLDCASHLIPLYKKMGGRHVKCDYMVPGINGVVVKGLNLISMPLEFGQPENKRTYAEVPVKADFLHGLCTADGWKNPYTQPEFNQMIHSLEWDRADTLARMVLSNPNAAAPRFTTSRKAAALGFLSMALSL